MKDKKINDGPQGHTQLKLELVEIVLLKNNSNT